MLLGAIDDVVLQRFGQRSKQRTVTRDADYQRAVFFGVLLRVEQGFPADDIELHMAALLIEVRTDQRYKRLQPALPAEGRS